MVCFYFCPYEEFCLFWGWLRLLTIIIISDMSILNCPSFQMLSISSIIFFLYVTYFVCFYFLLWFWLQALMFYNYDRSHLWALQIFYIFVITLKDKMIHLEYYIIKIGSLFHLNFLTLSHFSTMIPLFHFFVPVYVTELRWSWVKHDSHSNYLLF